MEVSVLWRCPSYGGVRLMEVSVLWRRPSYRGVRLIEVSVKAGVHLKAVFPPLNLGLMRISRSRFQLSAHFTKLRFAVIIKFCGDFWEEIVFLKD